MAGAILWFTLGCVLAATGYGMLPALACFYMFAKSF